MGIRVCVCLILLHMIAVWLPCSAVDILIRTPASGVEEPVVPNYIAKLSAERDRFWQDVDRRGGKYFYVHDEARIATARAEATLPEGGDRVSPLLSVHVPGTFPDFTARDDGCYLQSAGGLEWFVLRAPSTLNYESIKILAVDSCAWERNTVVAFQEYELCSQPWVKKPDILIRSDNPRSFKVLVRLSQKRWRMMELENEIIAEGVYFPATGKMHLVGCSYKPAFSDYSWPRLYEDPNMTLDYSAPPQATLNWSERMMMDPEPPVDPDTGAHDARPLNSSTPEDCAISITLQFPALQARWNRDRVVRYDIRSKRERSDPLYFDPLERSVFHPYYDSYDNVDDVDRHRRIEMWGRIVLLLLGLVCLALQIEHGRRNEEALPFVSLVMVGIQLTHHFSQTSIIKDLRIGAYVVDQISGSAFPDPNMTFELPSLLQELRFDYYDIMAWSEHIPYQAMAMAAIFMYVWIFHRVGDRRRIMSLRVWRKRPGARDAPSEWRVLYATLAFFSLIGLLGFLAISGDRHRLALEADHLDANRERWISALAPDQLAAMAPDSLPLITPNLSHFIPWQLYELWQARWRIVNKLTGLVVSLFLVPQLLGNAQWEVQGRPLSGWFYAGIPLLQSLPYAFRIGQYFDLLPIFSFYDPYFNSVVGMYESTKVDMWWPITVVVCSAAQVLAVHAQFLRSLNLHSNPKSTTGHAQTCDML